MEKGVESSTCVDAVFVDGKFGKSEVTVPAVLASVGAGAQRVADDAVGTLHLGVGVLVVGRADDTA